MVSSKGNSERMPEVSQSLRDKELTTRGVAQMLGFSSTAVIMWVKKGLLRVRVTPGGHRRYRQADVNEFAACLARGEYRAPPQRVEQKLASFLKKPGIKPGRKASNSVR